MSRDSDMDDPNYRHDLANVVSGITGYAHLLASTDLDAQQRRYVEEILQETARAADTLKANQPGPMEALDRLADQWSFEVTHLARDVQGLVTPVMLAPLVEILMASRQAQPGSKRHKMTTRLGSAGICSHCGTRWQMPTFEIILEDKGAPVPRSLLAHIFKNGFNTEEVSEPGAIIPALYHMVTSLHELGGHVVAQSSGDLTRFILSMPIDERSQPGSGADA